MTKKENDSFPLISFLLLTYMQENYVEDAFISALNQDYKNLEIIVSDDHSTDNTFKIIRNIAANYQGPHKVVINQNNTNLGLASNINNGVELASGELIVIQAGDDLSVTERTSKLVKIWLDSDKKLGLVFSDVTLIDNSGAVTKDYQPGTQIPTLEQVLNGSWFIAGGMACAYSRKVMSKPSMLNKNIVYEDFVLSFRALASGGAAHCALPLVKYRVHDKSIMGQQRHNHSIWDRKAAAKFAKHQLATYQDRLSTFKYHQLNHKVFLDKINSKISYFDLELTSSTDTRTNAIICVMRALLGLRIKTAIRLLLRDVILH